MKISNTCSKSTDTSQKRTRKKKKEEEELATTREAIRWCEVINPVSSNYIVVSVIYTLWSKSHMVVKSSPCSSPLARLRGRGRSKTEERAFDGFLKIKEKHPVPSLALFFHHHYYHLLTKGLQTYG